MRTVETLIDEASAFCGSDRKLCERTGIHPTQLSNMRAGRIPITPERVGLLCDVLELDGEEARRLLALAVVASAKDKSRAEVLRRAFFVSLALGVVWALQIDPVSMVEGATLASFTGYTLARIALWLCRARSLTAQGSGWLSRSLPPLTRGIAPLVS